MIPPRHQQRFPSYSVRRSPCLGFTSLSLFFACLSGALAYYSLEESAPPQLLRHYTIRGSPFRSSVEAKEHIDPTFHPVLQQETPLCSVPLIQQDQEAGSQPATRYGQGGGQGFVFVNQVATGQYTPPDPTECPWTKAVLEFSGSARGDQQRDRIGAVWIDGVEVLRTTTPVPTMSGLFWKVRRDITRYSSLLRRQEGGEQGQGGGASVVVALEDAVMGGGPEESQGQEEGAGQEDVQVNVILHFYGMPVPAAASERFGGRGSQQGQREEEQGPSGRGGRGSQYGQKQQGEQGQAGRGGRGSQYGQKQQGEQGQAGRGGRGGSQYGQQGEGQGSFEGGRGGGQGGQGSFEGGGGGQGSQFGQGGQGSFGGGGGGQGSQYGQGGQGSFGAGGEGAGQGPQYGQEGQGSFGGGGQGSPFGREQQQGSFGQGGQGSQFEQGEEQGPFGQGGQQQQQQPYLYSFNNRKVIREVNSGDQSSSASQEALHLLYGKPADLIIPISNVDQQQQPQGEGGGYQPQQGEGGGYPQFRYENPEEAAGGGAGAFGGGRGGGMTGSGSGGDRGYWFRIEDEFDSPSRTIQIPPNTHRAVLEIFVSSHLDEEFWYSSPHISEKSAGKGHQTPFPFQQGKGAWGAGSGTSSLRQVFASVDGLFVGSAVPFPVVYSGGINPLFWSPVAALGAFDLPTYDLELTPFLGNLLDGSTHEIRLGVIGAKSFWLVSANLHLWLDQDSSVVQGKLVRYRAPNLSVSSSSSSQGSDGESKSKIDAERKLVFSGWVSSSLGNFTTHVEQGVEFKNTVEYKHDGRSVVVDAKCKCETEVKVKDENNQLVTKMERKTKYPLKIETSLQVEEVGAYRSQGSVSHELNKEVTVEYTGVKYTDVINNKQKAEGWMLVNGDGVSVLAGSAKSDQTYSIKSRDGCYHRSVTVQDGMIQHDGLSPTCSSLVVSA